MSPSVRAELNWVVPPSVLVEGIDEYQKKLQIAVEALLLYFAPQLEAFAKAYAPWTDRTTNARQSLFALQHTDGQKVYLYLSHGMEYGVYLELRWSGKYAIVMPTIHAYEGPVINAVRDLLR